MRKVRNKKPNKLQLKEDLKLALVNANMAKRNCNSRHTKQMIKVMYKLAKKIIVKKA